MSKFNAVGPHIETQFKSDIDDADRFKDISFYIYKQNLNLYSKHFNRMPLDNEESQVQREYGISHSLTDVQASKVCVIL